ncbi:hypothetical protein [Vagococcus hydrophili]|uniref:Uncharacterized protein n=1 Tax=Vagococcus hydrophili TaxID=2714947 RepID=A0A6G8ATQ3_9ENTE|nr:hypothetical protein [Vagococcus hydrophili]QIL48458.1 hypothetical protein G7082_08085 [Vagococcus hydrophili]
MNTCPECYSEKSRITPMYKPYECLSEHTQYVCGTCHRCICIEKDQTRGLYRWNFPFKSLEDAKLYFRTAEFVLKEPCAIYELKPDKNRSTFKIFRNKLELTNYLKRNKTIKCNKTPVFKTDKYCEYPKTEVRRLTMDEVNFYMSGR